MKHQGIIARAKIALNVTEEGKIGSFFLQAEKVWTSEINRRKSNLLSLENSHKDKIRDLEDKIEDAKESLEETYVVIDTSKIKSREDQKYYVLVYEKNINEAIDKVEALESSLELTKEHHKKQIDAINSEILELQARIKKLDSFTVPKK